MILVSGAVVENNQEGGLNTFTLHNGLYPGSYGDSV
jgi:hypothetical protein